jgi:hypothetical protein
VSCFAVFSLIVDIVGLSVLPLDGVVDDSCSCFNGVEETSFLIGEIGVSRSLADEKNGLETGVILDFFDEIFKTILGSAFRLTATPYGAE